RGVSQGSAKVWRWRTGDSRPFSDEDLWASAWSIVIVVDKVQHLRRWLVVMIVLHIRLLIGCLLLYRCGRNQLVLRILLPQRPGKLSEARIVAPRLVEPVFIADLDIVQRKRSGVTIASSLGAPFGIAIASNVFDFVNCCLHVGIEILARADVITTKRVPSVYRKHRLDLQDFAPLQEFEQSHAVGGPVCPGGLVAGTV